MLIVADSSALVALALCCGLIAQVRPYLERLEDTEIRISKRLIERTLALAGEWRVE